MTYERVRARSAADGRVVTATLRILNESSLFLTGEEVRSDGTLTDRVHLIDQKAILSRTPLTMSLKYGVLEETTR